MVTHLELGEVAVEVVLKDIQNIHLSVYPPAGRVRISAPSRMSLDAIRVFAISKLGWIKQQQSKFREQERESHFVWGKRYLLKLVEEGAAPRIELKRREMILRVRPGTNDKTKRAIVARWYREQIKTAMPGLVAKWEPILGVKVERVFVQQMKTKWGGCNPTSRSIRVNSDLAKKPSECLEYIVVHEMAHLLVRHHNDFFKCLMDKFLPSWRQLREVLNHSPLAHVEWRY